MLLLDLEHSGKLCEDLIIHGSNYGFVGAWTALCCSVFAAIAIVAHFNVLTKLVLLSGPSEFARNMKRFCLYSHTCGPLHPYNAAVWRPIMLWRRP